MGISWPDEVDQVIGGDLAAGVVYATPAKGVVIAPMAPLGLRDRERGTVTVTTSLGLWKKLDRIRSNPSVAIAFHARDHADTDRPEFVLVQGNATFSPTPDRAWLESIGPEWEHFLGPIRTGLTGKWMEVYYWQRVAIEIDVSRVVVWPDLGCHGEPVVHGDPLPAAAPSQSAPRNGTGPRQKADRLAKEIGNLPHSLLGWIGGDGLPMAVAVSVGAGAVGPGGGRVGDPRLREAPGRPARRAHRTRIHAEDDRPGAAHLHGLARRRRRTGRLRPSYARRLQASRLQDPFHARGRRRHPRRDPQGSRTGPGA